MALSYYSNLILVEKFESESRIVGRDFRLFYVIVNLSFILFTSFIFFKKKILFSNHCMLFNYIFSFIALSVLVSGLNFQYERINMMMLILQIFLSSLFIKSSQRNNYLLVVISALLFLTIYTDMYAS